MSSSSRAPRASTSKDLDHSKTDRAKFFKRWPKLRDVYAEFERNGDVIDYSKETKIKESLSKEIEAEFKKVANDSYASKTVRQSLSSMLEKKIYGKKSHDERLRFMIFDELLSYYLDNRKTSVVVKYYAQRTFQKLRQDHLSYLWDRKGKAKKYKGMDRSDSFRWLEWSIMFLSEFFHQEQLTIDLYVESELDHLADEVIELLKKKNPTHPLFGVTRDQLRQWNLIGFVANKFDDQATREILDCQCELFEKLEFEVDNENEKDLIDIYEALDSKKGAWQVIFTIFMGVAHRLGVYCRLVSNGCDVQPDLGWAGRSSNESDDKTKKKFKKKSSKGSDDSDSDDELVPSDEKRPKGAKLFALDIFDSSREQHEEANNESLIFEVFGCSMAIDKIPYTVCGELRAELMHIVEPTISYKYQMSDSSDEEERYHDRRNRWNDYEESSDEERSSDDDEESGHGFSLFGFLMRARNSGGRSRKKTDVINFSENKFKKKLAAIRRREKAFKDRQAAREQEKEENRGLKSQSKGKSTKKSGKKN